MELIYELHAEIDSQKALLDEHVRRDHTLEIERAIHRHRWQCATCEEHMRLLVDIYNCSPVKYFIPTPESH